MPQIFESPDGKTVFSREISSEKDLEQTYQQLRVQLLVADMEESKLWEKIRRAAHTNPMLQDLLDQAKMVYELSRKNED